MLINDTVTRTGKKKQEFIVGRSGILSTGLVVTRVMNKMERQRVIVITEPKWWVGRTESICISRGSHQFPLESSQVVIEEVSICRNRVSENLFLGCWTAWQDVSEVMLLLTDPSYPNSDERETSDILILPNAWIWRKVLLEFVNGLHILNRLNMAAVLNI